MAVMPRTVQTTFVSVGLDGKNDNINLAGFFSCQRSLIPREIVGATE